MPGIKRRSTPPPLDDMAHGMAMKYFATDNAPHETAWTHLFSTKVTAQFSGNTSMTATTPSALPSNRTAQNADELLKRYATQLTSVLGFVVCITGIMMFFRWYKGEVEAMHEWLGLAFVAAVVLHITRHRRPLLLMLGQYRTRILLAGTVLVSAAFLVIPPPKTASPVKQTVAAVLRAPLADVAPLFGMSAKDAAARLSEVGVQNVSVEKSIEGMARSNNTPAMKLLSAILDQTDKD